MPLDMTPSSMLQPRFALSVTAALLLCADTTLAQSRGGIGFSPSVDLFLPGSYYAREFEGERSGGEVSIRQKPLALFGAQLSYELPGTAWRLGLGYARGESDLKVHHFAREGGTTTPGGPPPSSTSIERRYEEPATREVVTLGAARQLAGGPLAHELGVALVHQRLAAVTYGGFLAPERVEGRYDDWGLQLGASTGPSSGRARGLRVGARVHLLRSSPELFEQMRIRSWEPAPDAGLETALAVSLGWRVTF